MIFFVKLGQAGLKPLQARNRIVWGQKIYIFLHRHLELVNGLQPVARKCERPTELSIESMGSNLLPGSELK
jgi:hypothetical protein